MTRNVSERYTIFQSNFLRDFHNLFMMNEDMAHKRLPVFTYSFTLHCMQPHPEIARKATFTYFVSFMNWQHVLWTSVYERRADDLRCLCRVCECECVLNVHICIETSYETSRNKNEMEEKLVPGKKVPASSVACNDATT